MKNYFTAAALLLTVSVSPLAAQVSIDFDGTGAPCTFGATSPLTNLYSGQGVTFSGGGSILNECSNFSHISARSGTDFLAYSFGGTGQIQFSSVQSQFQIYAAATNSLNISYFLGGSQVGASALSFADATVWNSVSFAGNFDEVSFGTTAGFFIMDDLSTSAAVAVVPEPSTYAMMGLGLFAVAFTARRRRKQ